MILSDPALPVSGGIFSPILSRYLLANAVKLDV